MELELYAPVPDGYELVGFRAPYDEELFVEVNGVVRIALGNSNIRMIVREIKPRIKRSFRVDVLDEEDRHLKSEEFGLDNYGGLFIYKGASGVYSTGSYTPCIVTELPVENE